MDETSSLLIKIIGGVGVVGVLGWLVTVLMSGKLRRSGEFDDLIKRHADEVLRLMKEIEYERTKCAKVEARLDLALDKLSETKRVARTAVKELENNR